MLGIRALTLDEKFGSVLVFMSRFREMDQPTRLKIAPFGKSEKLDGNKYTLKVKTKVILRSYEL